MRTPVAVLGVVLLLVASAGSTTVTQVSAQEQGTVVGSPSISIAAPENSFGWGQTREMSVIAANSGELTQGGPERFEERVTTARNVRVEVATDRLTEPLASQLEVGSGATVLGSLEGSSAQRVNLTLGVTRSLPPGQYEIPVRVSYEYTSFVRYGDTEPEYNDASRTVILRVPIVVEDQPRLAVSNVQSTPVEPGDTGRLTFQVTNTGTQPAQAVSLALQVDDVAVHLGGKASAGASTNVFVGTLEPGESRTLTVTVGAYAATASNTYLVAMTAQYREPGGFEAVQNDLRLGVQVVNETA